MSTITKLRSAASPLVPQTPEEAHKIRVAGVLGMASRYFPDSIREALRDGGFRWMITSASLKDFPYAAGIGPQSSVRYEPPEHSRYPALYPLERVRYVGDIPESAMDRIAMARRAGIEEFTVHSNRPLPISLERIFTKVDPILVGWVARPEFRLAGRACRVKSVDPNVIGVIVAVWDNDVELEL